MMGNKTVRELADDPRQRPQWPAPEDMGQQFIPQVRRPLSPAEKWYWIADQVSPVTGVARVHLRGHITTDLLERATAALAAENPLLRVSITAAADGTNPAFVPSAGAIAIRRVNGDDLEWERQVEHELGTPLDWRRGPLVRIVDVVLDSPDESHDLLLAGSHIIADGVTGLSLLHRLVEHAGRLSVATGDDHPVQHVVESRPVVGAPDDLLSARDRGVRGIATFAATGLADQLAAAALRPARLVPELVVPPEQRRTKFVRRALTSTQVDHLRRRCAAEGATVHGALAAAMAMVIGPAAAQKDSGRICLGSPVNIRADLDAPVSVEEVGAYVAMTQSILRFGGDRNLWSVARQANRSVRRHKRFRQHLALLYALRFICPKSVAKSGKAFQFVERQGPGRLCISNMGRYPFPARIGEWRLSGAQLMANLSISGYFAAIINTCHDELSCNFVYVDGVVSDMSAQRFADGCIQTLLGAIN
jgi:hypothetical protein